MKTIFKSLAILLVAAMLFSCEKNKQPGTGSLDFQYSAALKTDVTGKPGVIPGDSGIIEPMPYPMPPDTGIIVPIDPMPPIFIDEIYAVLVTISDMSGKVILEKTEIPLYGLNDQYISKQIRLGEGTYQLTEFLVISASRKVLYGAPKAVSPKASMVKQPLPIVFSISAETTTHVVPEVVFCNGGISASDLGYATFGFIIVKPPFPGVIDTTITPPPPPGMGFMLGQKFKLMQGMIIPCATEIMKIQFVSYKDSRCPINANCIWAGEMSVILNIYTNTSAYENVVVNHAAPGIAGPYTIQLVDLQPYPAEVTIPEKTAVLIVTKGMEVMPMMK